MSLLPRPRAVSLAARGAGAHAGPRVAKAVAVRVLAHRGVPVAGWCDPAPVEEPDGLTMFRARLDPPADPPAPTESAGALQNPDAPKRHAPTADTGSRPDPPEPVPTPVTSREDRPTP